MFIPSLDKGVFFRCSLSCSQSPSPTPLQLLCYCFHHLFPLSRLIIDNIVPWHCYLWLYLSERNHRSSWGPGTTFPITSVLLPPPPPPLPHPPPSPFGPPAACPLILSPDLNPCTNCTSAAYFSALQVVALFPQVPGQKCIFLHFHFWFWDLDSFSHFSPHSSHLLQVCWPPCQLSRELTSNSWFQEREKLMGSSALTDATAAIDSWRLQGAEISALPRWEGGDWGQVGLLRGCHGLQQLPWICPDQPQLKLALFRELGATGILHLAVKVHHLCSHPGLLWNIKKSLKRKTHPC